MNRQEFKETLLGFLSDVTTIPAEVQKTFINYPEPMVYLHPAPDGFVVLSNYVLVKQGPLGDGREFMIQVKLFTEVNVYTITAIHRNLFGGPYLGLTVQTRKPRAGEDWKRGSDLHDGNFNKKTWQKIKNDIVRTEMKALSNYVSGGYYREIWQGQREAAKTQ